MARDLKNIKLLTRPDLPDERDYAYARSNKELRDIVDLRSWASPVDDQGDLGSCTANALVNAYELLTIKNFSNKFTDLSRLFVYYNVRLFYNDVENDTGASLRDTIITVEQNGICSEQLWPYNIEKFAIEPPIECFQDADNRLLKNYYRLSNTGDILDAVNNDHPVIFGCYVYESFMYVNKDHPLVYVPMYTAGMIGAHAMCIVGYDLSKNYFIVKNSFGIDWGINGYCLMPFDYVSSQGFDIWILDPLYIN